jgi:hypothetical protein
MRVLPKSGVRCGGMMASVVARSGTSSWACAVRMYPVRGLVKPERQIRVAVLLPLHC